MNILDTIIAQKQKEILSLSPLHDVAPASGPSFIAALMSRHPALIAEIKPKSPSVGAIIKRSDIQLIVQSYNRRAQALSVLCDEKFFGGGYDLLREVRALTELPILAKEFIIDPKQIDHAVKNGAQAVLLIARIADEHTLIQLIVHARRLNTDVLFEVHDVADVEKAVAIYNALPAEDRLHVCFGINNRNLDTLTIDRNTTITLSRTILERIKTDVMPLMISESGIETKAQIDELKNYVQGFLIGTSLLRSHDIDSQLRSILS